MASRLALQSKLEEIMQGGMVKFQPPPTVHLTYPCAIYDYSGGRTEFSDNTPYMYTRRYTVMLITRDADSDLPDKIAMSFRMCVHDRSYTADGLYHHVFTLYF